MRFWRRNKEANEVALPQEVQDYYAADKRDRRGVAGLLAVGTLLVTIVLAVGLFFGGRWAYRSIRNNNRNNKISGSSKTGTSSTSTNKPDSKPASNNGNNDSGSNSNPPSAQPGRSTTSPTSSSPVAGSTAAGSGSRPANPSDGLPSTGNGGSIAAFLAATLGSIAVAELYQRRKLTR